jgi:hypothetical protein
MVRKSKMNLMSSPLTIEQKALLDRLISDLKADVPNLESAVAGLSAESIEASGIIQRSVADFNLLLIASAGTELFLRHSAFYLYHVDAVFASRRAQREAICSYYGVAGAMLRSALEAF